MKILGIDPGLRTCGYAFISSESGDETLVEAGTVQTDSNTVLEARLNQIAEDFESLLGRFCPDLVAVEELYSHYDHPKTAILMGHARGVILQKCAEAKIEVKSFNATKIKKSLTGNGRASKQQVQKTIQTLLALPQPPEPDDIADAVAAALCCTNEINTIKTI